MPNEDLKEKILNEMLADHSNALEKNFQLAKQFFRITKEGKVDVLVKDKLILQDKVALYLIGKRYAFLAGLTKSEYVKNEELMTELGLPKGSLLPALMKLRDSHMLVEGPKEGNVTSQAIALNVIERALRGIGNVLAIKDINLDRSTTNNNQNGGN